jgi:hypothetical protein
MTGEFTGEPPPPEPTAPPVPIWTDQDLGTLAWSDDEAGWVGEHAGIAFAISRIRTADPSRPSPELIAYAKRVLGDTAWRAQCLAAAKQVAIAAYGAPYEAEILSLEYQFIDFYNRETGPAIIADMGEGPRDRWWRIEFDGERCEGLGFDT